MTRPRDRASAAGLLPLMEARPWKDGKTVTYRYHPIGGKPINLGTDKAAACRRVLQMTAASPDAGTIKALWQIYQETPDWAGLSERTREDYAGYSVPLLAVFGDMLAADITAPMVARYRRSSGESGGRRPQRIAWSAVLGRQCRSATMFACYKIVVDAGGCCATVTPIATRNQEQTTWQPSTPSSPNT